MNKEQSKTQIIQPGERIGLIADCHGMLEPLKVVLEDMKKRGITKIYSLGDNIGTGVNPSEVMDLLDEYKVISIAGNSEDYITFGIEPFSKYINERSSRGKERIKNIEWTKAQLSGEQIEKIKLFPRSIDLIIGGKKVALCHFFTDVRFSFGHFGAKKYQESIASNDISYLNEFYNITNSNQEKEYILNQISWFNLMWDEKIENPYIRSLNDALKRPLFDGKKIQYYDAIFQGHVHWKLYDLNHDELVPDIYSIRAVGMGAREENLDFDKASYVILTALTDGFDIEEVCNLEYDKEKMKRKILNSDGNNPSIRLFTGIDKPN